MTKFTFTKLQARYARFAPPIFLEAQDLYATDTVQNHPLGTMAFGSNGKIFRYAQAGASNLVIGNLLQARAQDTQFENMAVLASASVAVQNGAQTVSVTNGSTAVAANDFVGGSVHVYTTPDLGGEYGILGHTTDASGSATLTLTLDRPLTTSWTTSTKVVMKWNPWFKVIQFPTTQTSIPVGVALTALTAGSYGWVQTHGMTTVLSDNSTFAVGTEVGTSLATAGAVGVNVAGTTHATVGYALEANASGHGIAVFLKID